MDRVSANSAGEVIVITGASGGIGRAAAVAFAQPGARIAQPELAAQAIVWAARHRRREVYVGWPAVKATMANKIAPGLLDRILANYGYSGQITDEPLDPDACENLYEPCDTNPGAHGRFDSQARAGSVQWAVTKHRNALMAGAAFILGGIVGGIAARHAGLRE